MKTFESLWTEGTIQQIRQEYVASQSYYLCNASPTFADLWKDFKEEIRALAEQFIPGSQHDFSVSNVLFTNSDMDNKETRIEFLDYCLSIIPMKAKPFTQLWTAWRVSKIIREYKASGEADFLCHGSETFAKLWIPFHKEIREVAKLHFPPSEVSNSETSAEFATLFAVCRLKNYQTRLHFLTSELKRLKNK